MVNCSHYAEREKKMVSGLGFRVKGLGFRVQGFWAQRFCEGRDFNGGYDFVLSYFRTFVLFPPNSQCTPDVNGMRSSHKFRTNVRLNTP